MRVDEISGVIDEAVGAAPSGTAMFIVHGMGTGRLKAEVHSLLKRSHQVQAIFACLHVHFCPFAMVASMQVGYGMTKLYLYCIEH